MPSQHREGFNGRNTESRTALLKGVRVHDMTGARAVPYCPTILGDLFSRGDRSRASGQGFTPAPARWRTAEAVNVMPFDTVEEAIATANDRYFGLAATGWTHDINTALVGVDALHAGSVHVSVGFNYKVHAA